LKYCTFCGVKNLDDNVFCSKCGNKFIELDESGQPIQEIRTDPTPKKPELFIRNYLLWLLISLVVSPINLLYIYFNFEDMNKLWDYEGSIEGPSMKMDEDRIILLIFLSYVIPFMGLVIRYWKYKNFRTYLKYNAPKNQTIPISGKKYVGIAIIDIILLYAGIALMYLTIYLPIASSSPLNFGLFLGFCLLTSLTSLGLSIYLLYNEYKWQKAMNERILTICPNAEEKPLF